ncbi:MAG TPA: TfpX/TfpZ family type IV pilin accessory protein [Ramlibacter sp.]
MPSSTIVVNHHTGRFQWRSRLRAAAIHLALSVAVAAIGGLLVFALWYPYPYRDISGGRELFRLVVAVDVIIGPLITFAVFNRSKPDAELRRDLAVVAMLQLAALCYGLWTVHLARPVHMVFEYDRFRVVHQVDIPVELHDKAPAGIDIAPWGGPTVIALRQFASPQENAEMTMQALGGIQLSARPELWRPYATERKEVLLAAHPIATLTKKFPQRAAEIEEAVRKTGKPASQVVYLPLVARKDTAWTVLLDASSAAILAYLPLDPY